jgi:hypothetical protein
VSVDTNRTAATYAAFCRNYGDYNTRAVGPHNWNEEAIERMAGHLAAPWQSLHSELHDRHERIEMLIEDLMDWAIQYLGKSREDQAYAKGSCPICKMDKASAVLSC